MSTSSQSMRNLARRLMAATQPVSNPDSLARVLVHESLRTSLTRFSGAEGFASLLRRSFALVSASSATLQGLELRADGRVEGLDGTSPQDDALWREAALAVTAQLLELLVTFIGEPLTRRLVREACPEISSDE